MLLWNDLTVLVKRQHSWEAISGAAHQNRLLHNKAGSERFYSLRGESELHFVSRARIHKYIIMNYTQGGRQVQLQTL